jgi:hypothetical protein
MVALYGAQRLLRRTGGVKAVDLLRKNCLHGYECSVGSGGSQLELALCIDRVVRLWSRMPFFRSVSCLHRSIAIAELLLRREIPSRFVIGVAHPLDRLDAHAWIEVEGVALGEGNDSRRYRELNRCGGSHEASPSADEK